MTLTHGNALNVLRTMPLLAWCPLPNVPENPLEL